MWLCLSVWSAAPAAAQAGPPAQAVPFYTPDHLALGLHRHLLAPQAAALARETDALEPALQALCEAAPAQLAARREAARHAWSRAARAWDGLSALPVGPLLQRRSQRQIDFAPTRPALIERAINAFGATLGATPGAPAPADASVMERIGTPAKGFPALEWLLWTQPAAPGAPACLYARAVGADLARETRALAQAFAARAGQPPEGEDASAAMAEVLNQWVGALERLRWGQIEKPLREAQSRNAAQAQDRAPGAAPPGARGGAGTPDFPRRASGQTAASWNAQWQTLRTLAISAAGAAPAPGAGLVTLEAYLRGRGLNPLADRLRAAVLRVDPRMAAARPEAGATLQALTRELAALKRLAESDLAPALQINIGFSDADGD